MNIHDQVHAKILHAIDCVAKEESWPEISTSNISLEMPSDSRYGELSTNAAMILAPQLEKPVLDIAKLLKTRMDTDHIFFNISFVPAGFINFVLKPHFWRRRLIAILEKGDLYAHSNLGQNKCINIEYTFSQPNRPNAHWPRTWRHLW